MLVYQMTDQKVAQLRAYGLDKMCIHKPVKPLNTNPTKWSNTLKQFVGNFSNELFKCLTIL